MIFSIFFVEARTKTNVELIAVGVGSRSYGGFETDTDQKMVLANVNIQGRSLYKRNSKKKEIKADTSNFRNKVMRDKYKEETAKIKVLEEMSTQLKWNEIVTQCKTIGEKILGTHTNKIEYKDERIIELCKQKKNTK